MLLRVPIVSLIPAALLQLLQLGLLPLVVDGYAGEVYTTGITGAAGAGQTLAESSHFAWRSNNIQAYKKPAAPTYAGSRGEPATSKSR